MHIRMDSGLQTTIDTPDLAQALSNDTNGEFRVAVTAYLKNWGAQVKAEKDRGVAPDQFEILERLGRSIEAAERVIDFISANPAPDRGAAVL